MARILGLDLGSYTVKAVVLETTLRGFAVKSYSEAAVPAEGERLERLKAGLQALNAQGPLSADTIVTALPGTSLATHALTLPFVDQKQIDATLGPEIESQLPFDLSDAIYDAQTARADDKGTSLVVGVVKKTELEPVLAALKEAKLDARVVSHPALALQSLFATLPAAEGATALIDLGHERTSIVIGRGGAVELARTFAGGGLALSRALAIEFKIPLAEAQSWKETHGAVGQAVVGADAERAAGAFSRAFQPVLRELRSTLKSFAAQTHAPVARVFLCGGTSRLQGLAQQLEIDLQLPTRLLELPAEAQASVPGAAQSAAALAWAHALRGQSPGGKGSRFNFRKGEFAFKSDLDFMGEKVGQLVAFAAVLLVLLVAGGIVRNTVLERRAKQIDAMLCETTQRVLGTCEKDYSRAINMMKGQEGPGAGVPKRSAATLLAEITQRVPASLDVTFEELTLDLDRVSLRCQAPSSKDMEDIITALKTYRCFSNVKEGKVEKTKDGTKIAFRLDIEVECPDDAPATQG